MAEDMSQFTNIVSQVNPDYFKKIESGESGSEVSIQFSAGKTNEEQRHYILTWKQHKWQISPTNH